MPKQNNAGPAKGRDPALRRLTRLAIKHSPAKNNKSAELAKGAVQHYSKLLN